MPSPQLPNYLRANRRRLALFQEDVAFLLGKDDGGKVSRYETLAHLPNLETALAYEAIFKMAVSELFPALYEQIEKEIAERAKVLAARLGGIPNLQSTLRQKVLADLAS